jgi:hypothetical protein
MKQSLNKEVGIKILLFFVCFPLYSLRYTWWDTFVNTRAAYNQNKSPQNRQALQGSASLILQGSAKDVARTWKDQAQAALNQIAADMQAEKQRQAAQVIPPPVVVPPPAQPIISKPEPIITPLPEPVIPPLPIVSAPVSDLEQRATQAAQQALENWLADFEKPTAQAALADAAMTLEKISNLSKELEGLVTDYTSKIKAEMSSSLEQRIINVRAHLATRKRALEDELAAQQAAQKEEEAFHNKLAGLTEQAKAAENIEEINGLLQEAQNLVEQFKKDSPELQKVITLLENKKDEINATLKSFTSIKNAVTSFEKIQELGNLDAFLSNAQDFAPWKSGLEDALAAYKKMVGSTVFDADDTVKQAHDILAFIDKKQKEIDEIPEKIIVEPQPEKPQPPEPTPPIQIPELPEPPTPIIPTPPPLPTGSKIEQMRVFNNQISQWIKNIEAEVKAGTLVNKSQEELRNLQAEIAGSIANYRTLMGRDPSLITGQYNKPRYERAVKNIAQALLIKESTPPTIPSQEQPETPVQPKPSLKPEPKPTLPEVKPQEPKSEPEIKPEQPKVPEKPMLAVEEVQKDVEDLIKRALNNLDDKSSCKALHDKLNEYKKFNNANPIVIQGAQSTLKVLNCG